MARIEQRLAQLEHQRKAQRGIRVFENRLDNPNVFYEVVKGVPIWQKHLGEQPYTEAEIDELRAQGWQCIVFAWCDYSEAEIAAQHGQTDGR